MTKASEGGYSNDCGCETCEQVRGVTREIGAILTQEFELDSDKIELDDLLSALVTIGRVATKAFSMVENPTVREKMFNMWTRVIHIDAIGEPPAPPKSRIIIQ